MKKKYIRPEMKVYEMEPQQLLQASTETFKLGEQTSDYNDYIW